MSTKNNQFYWLVEFGNDEMEGQYCVVASDLQEAEKKADRLIFRDLLKVLIPLGIQIEIKSLKQLDDEQLVIWRKKN